MKTTFRFFIVLGFMLTLQSSCTFAQLSINSDNSIPDASSGLQVKFDNKGVLLPRMTFVQRNAIQNPAEGLMVYCLNCKPDGSGTIAIFQGGKWLNLVMGSCATPNTPLTGTHIPSVTEIIWKWDRVPIATGYKWSTVNSYATAIDMGSDTSKIETGLSCWTTYSRYIWAYNSCGNSVPCNLSQTTDSIQFSLAPTEGIHVPGLRSVIWNWNPVAGATGYKWNTTDDYSSATDMMATTTTTETGLSCNTSYTRFVWAYNGCGYSTSVTLNKTTLACLNCGSSITINHVAGEVAPVTKTVTYGIVTNIPGESSVCWITQNLGASQQANAVTDVSEPSAGWYWQFNRKQGYQYTTTRTPATTWINTIDENSDWMAANDPCTLELGTGWRIPTATEWVNVDATGNWTNGNSPWNSDLKIHYAGILLGTNGSLYYRGSYGFYWSNSQNTTLKSWTLEFNNSYCIINNADDKSNGFPLRCLRDN